MTSGLCKQSMEQKQQGIVFASLNERRINVENPTEDYARKMDARDEIERNLTNNSR